MAGDEALDDGRPGKVIGKSEMSKTDTIDGPFGTTHLSTGGGTLVTVEGALLSTAFGLVDGGTFNIGPLLTGTAGAPFEPVSADPAEPPVTLVSSSSSITMGCSNLRNSCKGRSRWSRNRTRTEQRRCLEDLAHLLDRHLVSVSATWLDEVFLTGKALTPQKPEAAHCSQREPPGLCSNT